MTYDPFKADYDTLETEARKRDHDGVTHIPKHELSMPEKVRHGDIYFGSLYQQHRAEWQKSADELGVSHDLEPSTLLYDVDRQGRPFTTHDETIHGDGKLADGVSIYSEVGRSRCFRNMRHVMGVVTESRKGGREVKTLESNCAWNWTKGRPSSDRDEDNDVVHAVGEKVTHPTPSREFARCYVTWPDQSMRKPGKKQKLNSEVPF